MHSRLNGLSRWIPTLAGMTGVVLVLVTMGMGASWMTGVTANSPANWCYQDTVSLIGNDADTMYVPLFSGGRMVDGYFTVSAYVDTGGVAVLAASDSLYLMYCSGWRSYWPVVKDTLVWNGQSAVGPLDWTPDVWNSAGMGNSVNKVDYGEYLMFIPKQYSSDGDTVEVILKFQGGWK